MLFVKKLALILFKEKSFSLANVELQNLSLKKRATVLLKRDLTVSSGLLKVNFLIGL
jgi:hypothetical protein